MLKKTITYENPFTNQTITEDHYFHISKADLVEMEVSQQGGMQKYIERIVASEDGKEIMATFKDILRRAHGRKEGDRFIKNQETWDEFVSSEAYSQLFFELCTDAEKAVEFMNGVVPKNLETEVQKVTARLEGSTPAEQDDPTGLTQPTPEEPRKPGTESWSQTPERQREIVSATTENPVTLTRAEMIAMDHEALSSGLAEGRYKLS